MKNRIQISLTVLSVIVCATVASAQADKSTKPRIAVIEFQNNAGPEPLPAENTIAIQEALNAQLKGTGKFRIVEREPLKATMKFHNLNLSAAPDTAEAVKIGKLLGVNYVMTGSVTEYGVTDKGAHGRAMVLKLSASLVNISTGRVVWTGEARHEEPTNGNRDGDRRLFSKAMKPVIQKLIASFKANDGKEP